MLKRAAILTLLIAAAGSCSTEKDRWLNRGYHNMTARFNGYFNAKETIRIALMEYGAEVDENYFEILPVFLYPGSDEADAINGQMETAIKKTSIVITKHSMPNPSRSKDKREEWCRWIDENWLVMGQAYFYKHEYKEALDKLKYVRLTYPELETIYYADLWTARTLIDKKDYGNALAILQKLEETIKEQKDDLSKIKAENKKIMKERKDRRRSTKTITPIVPKDIQQDIAMVYADFHIRKKEYGKAADRLKEAIALTKKRKVRARQHFILAQVYQKLSENPQASLNYEKAMKLTPDYKLAFHAKIFRALMYSGNDTRGIRAELKRMLKDDKNAEFKDQIYYALGELDMKENKRDKAIENFLLSARFSMSNDRQKTRTYHRLGDIHYDDQIYPEAKAFYDSCMSVIEEEYPAYETIKNRSEGLTDLVENLNLYTYNDSLLTLVEKGEKYYLEVIDQIIEDYKEEEEKRRNRQAEGSFAPKGAKGEGNWYFYNAEALAFGFNEFKKIWGTRSLEDNWRRKDKTSLALNDFGSDTADAVPAENDPYSREFYVKNLPFEEEEQQAAHKDVAKGLYNLGVIYRERFMDDIKAEYYFNEVVKRYKPDESCLAASFQLYTLLKEKGRTADSDVHRKFILETFPKSDYAQIILDPNYLKIKEEESRQQEVDYQVTYEKFTQKRYGGVLVDCDKALADHKNNAFAPKYFLLKAYAMGELDEKKEDIAAVLQECVKHYKETPEGIRAQKILDRLRNEISASNAQSGTSPYVFNADMEHFFVLIYPNSGANVSDAKRAVSDFNRTSFKTKAYKVSNTFLNPETQMVIVKSFANKTEAQNYRTAFLQNKNYVGKYNQGFQHFLITHKNYATLFLEKNIDQYLEFFGQNYE